MSASDALEGSPEAPALRELSVSEPRDFAWRVLILLNLFRLALSLLLFTVFYLIDEPRIVGESDPGLAWAALAGLLAFGCAELVMLYRRWPSRLTQTYLQFGADLAAIVLLIHASGGVSSGLGGVLVVSVGVLALLVETERAFLLAAIATLALLLEQTFAQFQGLTTAAQFASTGILGAVIFIIAGLVQLLRRQIVETEALAEQRSVDLRNLVELNDYIIQHLRESIVVVDDEAHVRLINDSALKHLGVRSTAAGRALADVSRDLDARLREWRAGETRRDTSAALPSSDGSTSIEPHFAPLGASRAGGVLIFLEDTSLIAERVQQAKLAALGRLSASIAHEIRNPLGAMNHAGQLLAESPSIGTDERRLTDIIRVNARRVSQIVESVLTLSRRGKAHPQRLQLKSWLEDFAREFAQTLDAPAGAVAVSGASADVEGQMDPTHLHQIVWNLCDNAAKYAREASGAIAIELGCGTLTTSRRPFIEIADRGPGIAAEQAEQIFEPFYTGQPGGTGLGLYISRELCERNGATLRYQARRGGGSVFRVVFADPNRWQSSRDAA